MARWEQLLLSTVATLIFGLTFYTPHPYLQLTPAFTSSALAAFAVLVGGLSCSPGSERALQVGAASFAAVVGAHLYRAGVSVRPGIAVEALALAAGLASAAFAAPRAAKAPAPTKTTKSKL